MSTIKPLEWQETSADRGDGSHELSGFEAETPFGTWYLIEIEADCFTVEYDLNPVGRADSPDEAKAIAQHDFEQRIRRALAAAHAQGDSAKRRASKRLFGDAAWLDRPDMSDQMDDPFSDDDALQCLQGRLDGAATMSVDRVYEEVMAMSEEELVAELAKEGETLESNARKMRLIFERAKAQVAMEAFIKAWLKCPAEKRPSVLALCDQIQRVAHIFLTAESNSPEHTSTVSPSDGGSNG